MNLKFNENVEAIFEAFEHLQFILVRTKHAETLILWAGKAAILEGFGIN